MKLIARTVQTLALVVALFPASLAFAEQPRGVYIGIGAGDANADISTGDINQLFREAFAAQGATFTAQTSSIETKDSSLYVFGGYRIFPWLSAEGGYINLGGFDYTSNGSVSIPGVGLQQITTHMKVESQGVAVSALGNYPLSDYFEIHARVGFFGVSTDATVNGGSSSRPVNASDSGFSFSAQVGVGAAVNIGDHFSLSADWVHFFGVDSGGGSDNQKDNIHYDGYDVDTVRLSVIARF